MNFSFLIPPLIGGVIGYITNAVAIKMLFRPRRAVYIGKHRLPFTPGLIPREKARVARSVGNVISTQLLNTETLAAVLTSENTTSKIRNGIKEFVEKNKDNNTSLGNAMLWFMSESDADAVTSKVQNEAARFIYNKITGTQAREAISSGISNLIKKKMGSIGLGVLDKLFDPIARGIGSAVNDAIYENGYEIVEELISSETDKLKKLKICDVIDMNKDKMSSIADFVMNIYMRVIRERLGQILESIDIAKIVEDRIASFDVIQLENMIFGIMKKELNAIVYLGALLGFIMGWLNLLVKF